MDVGVVVAAVIAAIPPAMTAWVAVQRLRRENNMQHGEAISRLRQIHDRLEEHLSATADVPERLDRLESKLDEHVQWEMEEKWRLFAKLGGSNVAGGFGPGAA